MKKIKYVLVGFGGIAENRVAKEGYACDKKRFPKGLKYAELVGATDLNPAREAAAKALGLKWYPSLDDVLADKDVDAVYIATNNLSHVPLGIKCLKAGKHVISEKPIATSVADAKAMNKVAKAKKLSLTVDHMMVNNAWHVAAKAAIAKGKLGKVNDGCFHMECAYGYTPEEAATWRCNKVEEMGGPIGDMGSHCFYVAEYVLGKKFKKVACTYYPKVLKIKAEDGAHIKGFFADNTQCSVNASFQELRGGLAGTLGNLGFEVYGDKAAMRGFGTMFQISGHQDEPYSQCVLIDNGKSFDELNPAKIQNIYQTLIDAHAKSIIDKKPMNADDAIHNLAIIAACHESAKKGGKICSVAC